jgi:hypothetical protein
VAIIEDESNNDVMEYHETNEVFSYQLHRGFTVIFHFNWKSSLHLFRKIMMEDDGR